MGERLFPYRIYNSRNYLSLLDYVPKAEREQTSTIVEIILVF